MHSLETEDAPFAQSVWPQDERRIWLPTYEGARYAECRVVRASVETAAIETPELLAQGIGIRGPGQDNLFNGG